MLATIQSFGKAIENIIFENSCVGCQKEAIHSPNIFCIKCASDLPYVEDRFDENNAFEKHFIGRCKITSGMALYHFNKEDKIQQVMHLLKYGNLPWIGESLGYKLGMMISQHPRMHDIEAVIPVPIHWRRKLSRGYNQSYWIALGISKALNIPVKDILKRKKHGVTQTKKSRADRMNNVHSTFTGSTTNSFEKNIHYLIVDDVITSGATLEACTQVLQQSGVENISLASLAMGK